MTELTFHPPSLHHSSSIYEPGMKPRDGKIAVVEDNGPSTIMWKMHLPKNSPESESRSSSSIVDSEGREINVQLPYKYLPDGVSSTMCRVCELCTRRKRKCSSNGGSQCCTLCLKHNLPCFYRMKLRRGPKRKLEGTSNTTPRGGTKQNQETGKNPHPFYKQPSNDPSGSSCYPVHPLEIVDDIPGVTANGRDVTVLHTESGSGGYNRNYQRRFGETDSGNDTGDNVWYVRPAHKNGGPAFQQIPNYTHASYVAHPGANLPPSLAAAPVCAPLDQIHTGYILPNYFVPALKSGGNGNVQDEGGDTGGNFVSSGQQMYGGVDDKPLHHPMNLMSNEALPHPNSGSPAPCSEPSMPTQHHASHHTYSPKHQKIAHFLANMANGFRNSGTDNESGNGATASNEKQTPI